MKNRFQIRVIVLLLSALYVFGGSRLKAQNQIQESGFNYSVALDTNVIVIGDQINLTFRAKLPVGTDIEFPILKDTVVKGIEIINTGKLKTISVKEGIDEKYLEYKITAFDTGVYKIPSFPIKIKAKGHDNIVRSEAIYLGVTTFKVDTQKGFADIYMPKNTPLNFAEIIPYLLWVLLGLGIIILGIFLYRKWKNKEPLFHILEKPKEPAHVIAYRELDRIKKDKLWERGNVKDFYTDVTNALRVYIENQFGVMAMEQTSIEILEDVRKVEYFDAKSIEKLEDILLRADFVKFAKAQPLGNENQKAIDYAYEIVSHTYKAVADKVQMVTQNDED